MGLWSALQTWVLRTLYGFGGVATLALALLVLFQEKLLYVPRIPGVDPNNWMDPAAFDFDCEDIKLVASDGVKLHAWLLIPKGWTKEYIQTRPVILFFQENAGNISYRLHFLRLMAKYLRAPIYALSYRGYGHSSGRPSEAGLKLDAEAALADVLARPGLNASKLVVYGRSLGGAVAIALAAKHQDKIKALIVENTFTSVEDMVKQVVSPLGYVIGTGKPLNFLVRNKWSNLSLLPLVTTLPLLMLSSSRDEVVPAAHMRTLHQVQRARTCEMVELPLSRHMDAYDHEPERYWTALTAFCRKHVDGDF